MTSNLSISAISDKEEENSKAFYMKKCIYWKKIICAEYFAYNWKSDNSHCNFQYSFIYWCTLAVQ